MSDHEFEKQVQARMGGLKLSPSEVLWPQVEKGIRRARRRRRIILWVPLMLLLIGGVAGYFVFLDKPGSGKNNLTVQKNNQPSPNSGNTDHNSTQTTVPSTTHDANNPAATNKTGAQGKDHTTGNDTAAVQVVPALQELTDKANKDPELRSIAPEKGNKTIYPPLSRLGKDHPVANKTKKHPSTSGKVSHKRITEGGDRKDPSVADRSFVQSADKKGDQKQARATGDNKDLQTTLKNRVQSLDMVQSTTDTLAVTPLIGAQKPSITKLDSTASKQPAIKQQPSKATAAQATAKLPPAKPTKDRIPSRWQFGVQANLGGSHISRSGLFDVFSERNKTVEDLAANPMQQSAPNGNAVTAIPPPSNKASGIKTGKSFSIGGFVQKPLSKRLGISAGLQYTYFSVETKVGALEHDLRLVNNALAGSQVVSNYYRGGTATTLAYWGGYNLNDYTNRYHFIELPVTLHTQLNKGKVLPIIWDAGVAFSYLFRTNALHYDGTNDVYYKDQSFFNPVQFSINTAVNVELFSKKRHPVVVGPRVNYQLSNLLKKEVSTGQHLWSFGVTAKMFLKK